MHHFGILYLLTFFQLVLSAEEVFLSANQSMPHHTFKTLKSASLYTIKVSSLANGDESEVTELEIISRKYMQLLSLLCRTHIERLHEKKASAERNRNTKTAS